MFRKCSGSGLDGFINCQTSLNEVLQKKTTLKSTNLQTMRTGNMAAAILDAILNN